MVCGGDGGVSVGWRSSDGLPVPEEQDLSQRPNGSQVGQRCSDQNNCNSAGVVVERELRGRVANIQSQAFAE